MPFDISARPALGILACALTALAYQSALELPFVFDDRSTVLLNPALLRAWDLPALVRAWGLPALGSSDTVRTAATLSYALDRAFWGFSSFGFHVTNGILHMVVVALFYGTCTRVLADADRRHPPSPLRGSVSDGAPALDWVAFFAAAAFGLHPLMSATALYVSARSEMLCAASFMIALIFARRAILTSRPAAGLMAAGFGAAAVGSSPAGAGLPIVLLAYDAWLLRTDGWRRRLWRAYIPAMTAVVLVLGGRLYAQGPAAARVLRNILTESIVVWRYLSLVVVPAGEAIVHDPRWVESLADPVALVSVAAVAAAVVAAIRLRRSAPLVSVGLIWFFAGLAATSTIFPPRDVMAEPRVYLSAAGLIFAAFGAAAPHLVARRAPRIAAAAVLAILAMLTSMRIRVWSDPLMLWTEAVERSPGSWQAHLEFSESLKEAGRCDRAVEEFAAASRLNPHLPLEPATGWAPCPRPPRDR